MPHFGGIHIVYRALCDLTQEVLVGAGGKEHGAGVVDILGNRRYPRPEPYARGIGPRRDAIPFPLQRSDRRLGQTLDLVYRPFNTEPQYQLGKRLAGFALEFHEGRIIRVGAPDVFLIAERNVFKRLQMQQL